MTTSRVAPSSSSPERICVLPGVANAERKYGENGWDSAVGRGRTGIDREWYDGLGFNGAFNTERVTLRLTEFTGSREMAPGHRNETKIFQQLGPTIRLVVNGTIKPSRFERPALRRRQ